jgi:hypothetical protein
MQTLAEKKSLTISKINSGMLPVTVMCSYKVTINKKQALNILHNLSSPHRVMLFANDCSVCYFIFPTCDVRLFLFMNIIYDTCLQKISICTIKDECKINGNIFIAGNIEMASFLLK